MNSKMILLNLQCAHTSPGNLVKMQILTNGVWEEGLHLRNDAGIVYGPHLSSKVLKYLGGEVNLINQTITHLFHFYYKPEIIEKE